MTTLIDRAFPDLHPRQAEMAARGVRTGSIMLWGSTVAKEPGACPGLAARGLSVLDSQQDVAYSRATTLPRITIGGAAMRGHAQGRRDFLCTIGHVGGLLLAGSGALAQSVWAAGDPIVDGRPLVRYPEKTELILLTARPPQLETPMKYFDR